MKFILIQKQCLEENLSLCLRRLWPFVTMNILQFSLCSWLYSFILKCLTIFKSSSLVHPCSIVSENLQEFSSVVTFQLLQNISQSCAVSGVTQGTGWCFPHFWPSLMAWFSSSQERKMLLFFLLRVIFPGNSVTAELC